MHGELAPVDQRGLQVQTSKRFTHLESDEPSSYHHRPSGPALLDETLDANGIRHVPQAEKPLEVLSGDTETPAIRAGSHHQVIEGHCLAVGKLHCPRIGPDGRCPGVKPHVDARLGEGFGRAGDQLGLVFDYIADVIGRGSGREGDVLTRLQYRHLQVGIETLCLGRSARSSSTPTDYY